MRSKREATFKRRVQKILEDAGYLVINTSMPSFYGGHIFDTVAIKDQIGIPIEIKAVRLVKGKRSKAYYPKKQREMQIRESDKANTMFVMIEQLPEKGLIKLHYPNSELSRGDLRIKAELHEVFKCWLQYR
jgi:Holliday junction resolvase